MVLSQQEAQDWQTVMIQTESRTTHSQKSFEDNIQMVLFDDHLQQLSRDEDFKIFSWSRKIKHCLK